MSMINVRMSDALVCVNGETGRDRNGGALAYVPTTYSCTTRRSRPSDSRVRESNRRIGYRHRTRDDRIRPCGLRMPAGSAGGLCRQTHGRGRMQALLRPRGLCRGPTRTRAWHRPQLSTVQRTHNIPGIGARLNPERGMVMDATGPVGGEERTACALSPACCRSDACEMSACLLIGERNGRRRRSRIDSRCCCCRCQRGQCSSR